MEKKRKIQFSVTDGVWEVIRHEAASKLLQPSQFCAQVVATHINRFPCKGVFSYLDELIHQNSENSSETPTIVGSQGKNGGSQ